jgi:manganese oxidase
MQAQAQRGILEFSYRWPGQYMYHAHVTEFTELGWMGMFNIVPEDQFESALEAAGMDAAWDELATNGAAINHAGAEEEEASDDDE